MTKNPTATRLVGAAGTFERALSRVQQRRTADAETAVTEAGRDLVKAIEDYAATADRAEAKSLYRITDAYVAKANGAFGPGGSMTLTKAGRIEPGVRGADGSARVTFGPSSARAAEYCDAALEMIIAARSIADRIQHGGV